MRRTSLTDAAAPIWNCFYTVWVARTELPVNSLPLFSDHFPDLQRLFEMIQPVGPDPPFRSLHQQLRIVIPVGKEGIEGQSDLRSLLRDFPIAHIDDFLSQGRSHWVIPMPLKNCDLAGCPIDPDQRPFVAL